VILKFRNQISVKYIYKRKKKSFKVQDQFKQKLAILTPPGQKVSGQIGTWSFWHLSK
jgi:hypothetical protein